MKNTVIAFCCLMILPVLAAQEKTGTAGLRFSRPKTRNMLP